MTGNTRYDRAANNGPPGRGRRARAAAVVRRSVDATHGPCAQGIAADPPRSEQHIDRFRPSGDPASLVRFRHIPGCEKRSRRAGHRKSDERDRELRRLIDRFALLRAGDLSPPPAGGRGDDRASGGRDRRSEVGLRPPTVVPRRGADPGDRQRNGREHGADRWRLHGRRLAGMARAAGARTGADSRSSGRRRTTGMVQPRGAQPQFSRSGPDRDHHDPDRHLADRPGGRP